MDFFITALIVTLSLFLVSLFGRRPGKLKFTPRNLTICAAHSDDCVIMGAEMAHQVLNAGHQVRIVYLTCSADAPEAQLAKLRREEACNSWALLGVSSHALHFLDLPQSPLGGRPSYGPEDLDRARTWLVQAFRSLQPGDCVLVPAAGESHVDHDTIRMLSLAALKEAGQTEGVMVYEVTEYNPFLSMLQDPLAVLNRIARSIPLLSRLAPPYRAAPGFISGPPGQQLRDPAALATKIVLLGAFHSQDPAMLRQYFSFASRYRRIPVPAQGLAPEPKRYFEFLEARSDGSVLIFFGMIAVTMFSLGFAMSPLGCMGLAGIGLLLVLLLLHALRRRRHPFALLCGATLLGLCAGVL